MRSLVLILLILCFITLPTNAEGLDDFSEVDRLWDGQQTITNQEYEQVIDALEEREKKREEKGWKKKLKRIGGGGTSLHKELNPESEIKEIDILDSKDEGVLINVPVDIILPEQILEKGFYKVIGERDKEGRLYINFYQSQYFKGKIEVSETQEDYDEKEIDFAKVKPYNDSFVKIIFGSIDFNAYVYLPFKK